MITALDVEKQLQEIMSETATLENRLHELDLLINGENDMTKEFKTAEELLNDLRMKIIAGSPSSFRTRREIIKTLVDEIIVETIPSPTGGRPKASVIMNYSFKRAKGKNHTLVRADTSEAIIRNINAHAASAGSPNTAPKSPVRCSTGSIFKSKSHALRNGPPMHRACHRLKCAVRCSKLMPVSNNDTAAVTADGTAS